MKREIGDLTAILFAVAGFTFWVLGDSTIKWIGQYGLPPQEVVAAMGLFMALTLLAQAAARRDLASLRPCSVLRQSLRSLLDMANNVCVVVALRHLSLAMFYILVFTSPVTIAVLSRLILKETITRQKALALGLGFAGVVVAVAPWSGRQRVDLVGLGACAICVACFSLNMTWSRVLTRTETTQSLAFSSGVVTFLAGMGFSCLNPKPLSGGIYIYLVAMGVFCAAGTLSFYVAVKHTSASNVAQYHYTQLLTGSLIGFLVWHDRPGPWMLAGGAMILVSGGMIAWEARQAGRAILQTDAA